MIRNIKGLLLRHTVTFTVTSKKKIIQGLKKIEQKEVLELLD